MPWPSTLAAPCCAAGTTRRQCGQFIDRFSRALGACRRLFIDAQDVLHQAGDVGGGVGLFLGGAGNALDEAGQPVRHLADFCQCLASGDTERAPGAKATGTCQRDVSQNFGCRQRIDGGVAQGTICVD